MTACSIEDIFGSVSVTDVSLNKMYTSIVVNSTETLFCKIEPSNATNKDVTWSSDKPDVAKVSANGEVTGLKAGEARITVTPKDGNKTASCIVAVINFGVYLNKDKTSLVVGGKETLVATIAPPTATNQKVRWSSDRNAVATVEDGVITGLGLGTATITVTTVEGGKTASCEVTVINFGVSLNKDKTSLLVGGKEPLFYNIQPDSATNKNVTWSSDKPEVAIVSESGEVTGKRAGKAIITVTTVEGGKTASCEVTVTNAAIPVTSVSLGTPALQDNPIPLEVYKTERLIPYIEPTTATNQKVTWTSSNTTVAVVSSDGAVTGLGVGTATITVTTEDGNKTASRRFIVSHTAITGIFLNKNEINLVTDTSETLIPYITPDNATNKGVLWTSSDSTIAKVSAGGLVTGVKNGEVTITVTTVIGNKSDSCTVTVSDAAIPVTGIYLNKSESELFVGQTETLIPIFTPSNTTQRNVKWFSDLNSSFEHNATVSEYGVVTGMLVGDAIITVQTENENFAATCNVKVSYITVTFDSNGGTDIPSQTKIRYNDKATRPKTDPTKSTYKFVDWYSDQDLKTVYDFLKPVSNNITLYAKWIIEMADIPAGYFQMGSPENEANRKDDERQHSVTLTGFKMGKYQVTQKQYNDVMSTNPSNFKSAVTGESKTPDELPVERVSWYNAIVFCNKLSVSEGFSPAYNINGSTDPDEWGNVPTTSNSVWNAVVIVENSNGYRLPTEAQWEYACRAGTTTAYNTGATATTDTGWYGPPSGSTSGGNSGAKTHQVGLKPANIWGLYDMHGNVFEWCWDWYEDDNTGSYPLNPKGPDSGTERVRRGGGWNQDITFMRSAYRSSHAAPNSANSSQVGFRVVRPN